MTTNPPTMITMSSSIITNNKYSYMDESTIDKFLKCIICSQPFVDPVSAEDGKTFCRTCIVSIYSRRQLPRTISDSDELTNTDGNDLLAAKIQKLVPVTESLVHAMLNSLLVRCKKCGLTNIKRGQLQEHENTSCPQAKVLCNAADIRCPWMGVREKLDDHMDECKYEPLRPALEFILNENAELNSRLESLEQEVSQRLATKGMNNMNLNS